MKPFVTPACLMTALAVAIGCGGRPADVFEAIEPSEVVHGSVSQRDRSGRAPGDDFNAVVAASTAFGLQALRVLREANPDGNVAVGVYSLSQLLGMVYAGARGATADEMRRALGWELPPERLHTAMNALDLELLSRREDVTLVNANRVWGQRGMAFLPAYLDVLTRDYGAPLAVADFAQAPETARATINDWVKRVTAAKIPQLFPAGTISAKTVLVLANAMYLDAPWKYRLGPPRPGLFTRLDGSRVDVPMMGFHEFLPSAGTSEWTAVELPYRGDELSMVFIVPRDLREFERRLTRESLAEILGRIENGGIHLHLPAFTFSFHTSLVQALTALGMPSLFGDADLSGITGQGGLQVAAVEHEVFIQVDEKGSKAAAATGASLNLSHGPTIVINRPFLFVLRDRPTGAVLFLGRVVDPTRRLR